MIRTSSVKLTTIPANAYRTKTRSSGVGIVIVRKDLIKFINSSSVARKMIADKASLEDIRTYAAGSKFRSITGNHNMTDDQVNKMAELLDDVSPRCIFKEFNDELRKKLKK